MDTTDRTPLEIEHGFDPMTAPADLEPGMTFIHPFLNYPPHVPTFTIAEVVGGVILPKLAGENRALNFRATDDRKLMLFLDEKVEVVF